MRLFLVATMIMITAMTTRGKTRMIVRGMIGMIIYAL